jgi:hypothetical protein
MPSISEPNEEKAGSVEACMSLDNSKNLAQTHKHMSPLQWKGPYSASF